MPSQRPLAAEPTRDEASELEWLFSVTAPARGDRKDRLRPMLAASVAHLDCALGAVLMPERRLRLVHAAARDAATAADSALRKLEAPLLNWVRSRNAPMLINQGRPSGAGEQALRVLAVPIAGTTAEATGALVLLRPADRREFERLDLALARNLGRHVAALLEADLDLPTGLYTRAGVERQVESWASAQGGGHAILCIIIDHLRTVNETKGLGAGDALIGSLARLLRRPHVPDGAIAARMSGNEFALVLPDADTAAAEHNAIALQKHAVRLAEEAGLAPDSVTLSCGVASFAAPGEFQRGLGLAALACKTARNRGRGRIEVYQDTDMSMVRRQTDVIAVHELREAMREDGLTLFAQRILPLQRQDDDGGYELLLRSVNELAENRAPARLISAALQNQLAPELDLWVLERALAQARSYRSELLEARLSLSINVTGPSLTDERFLERVRGLIRGCGLAPALITFEITEQVAVLSLAKAMNFIHELRALGCRFALDDFGTGANSLKNLTHLPVDRVKIDGSFVADILSNTQSEAMVRAIVGLARDLDIATVAEYAQDKRIVDRLRRLGVQYAQGYGVEKPRALADVLRELRERQDAGSFDLSLQF